METRQHLSAVMISVIIPTFNCSDYIIDAIDSVIKQKFSSKEIIVVDDGSVDSTFDVLRPYIDNNLIQYIYQKNGGVSSARNTGIRNSKGKYLAFLDADDIMLPKSLSIRFTFLNAYKDIKFVFSDYFVQMEEKGDMNRSYLNQRSILKNFKPAIKSQNGRFYCFTEEYVKLSLKHSIFPSTNTVMFYRMCLDKIGLFDEQLRLGQDEDLWFRIANKYSFGFIDEPLAVYKRFRSQNTKDKVRHYCALIEYLEQQLDGEMARNDHEVFDSIRKRLSRSCFELAYGYMNQEEFRLARSFFLKGFNNDKANLKFLLYVMLTFLPRKGFKNLRKIKRKIR